MDGDIDETTASGEQAAAEERVTPEQLIGYLGNAAFRSTLASQGYAAKEVDAFLARLAEAVAAGEPLAHLVRKVRFTPVRLGDGYETGQVDDFLAAVVDLDPHAGAARPEVERSGLVTRLFG